jgi:hypothetical protein
VMTEHVRIEDVHSTGPSSGAHDLLRALRMSRYSSKMASS